MRLLDLILRGGKTPEQEKAEFENRLHLEELGRKIGSKLNQPFAYNSLRRIFYSKDEVIGITTPERELYQKKRMRAVAKAELVKRGELMGDNKNMFRKTHFEAIGEALEWKCEILLSINGDAPAFFKTEKAGIWLSPVISKDSK